MEKHNRLSAYCAENGYQKDGGTSISVWNEFENMIDYCKSRGISKILVESWKDSILMKRLGDPREVADVIVFLASEKASFITGEVIQINGGQAFI